MSEADQQIWHGWAARLNRRGLGKGAALLLEAAGPLNLLAAQAAYVGQPLLGGWLPGGGLKALARMLEDPSKRQVFIQLLREAPDCEPGD